MTTTESRLTKLEYEMKTVLENQEEFKSSWKKVDEKLDTLLSLKDKGLGAFWLASLLAGTGIVGFLTWFVDILKHG